MRWIFLALAGLLVSSPASAQHCWPATIALVLRDSAYNAIDPAHVDSLEVSPKPGAMADFRVITGRIDPSDSNRRDGTVPAFLWAGRGDCRVDIREVVIRRQGVVMRLWMDLHIDTLRRPGPSQFMLDTPPLGNATWRLDVCALPDAQVNTYTAVPQGWSRVSTKGDEAPWQAPQACGASSR